jgi:methyl-accepting chemotaxis protein
MGGIGLRLVGGFLLVIAMMIALALYSVTVSRQSLTESIGRSSVFSAEDMMGSIDRTLERRLLEAKRPTVRAAYHQPIEDSNRAFDGMADREGFMQLRAMEWASAGPTSPPPSLRAVLGNPLSEDLKGLFIDFFMNEQGSAVYSRTLLTNRYGAVIATTDGTVLYRQDDQQWWQETRDKGRYVSGVTSDPQTGQPVVTLGVRVDGGNREFIGALQAVVSFESIVRPTVVATKKHETTQFRLFTTVGRLLYSTKTFQFMEDVTTRPFYGLVGAGSGSFTVREGGKGVLFAYTRPSAGVSYLPRDWVFLLGHDVDEVLKPASMLRASILIASAVLVIAGLLIALFISRSITRPVLRLIDAASEMGRGNLGKSIEIRRKDEIGSLADSFNAMNDSLKSMVSVAERIAAGDLTVEVKKRSEGDVFGSSLERMISNLKEQVKDILDAASRLAASTSQIFSATTQMASAAAESASAVGQTTATVEEVKQTAHLANEKSAMVSERSQRTVQIVDGGRSAVQKTRELMSRIKDQMESIAASILGLSEQSQAIGEIVMSVNDLADQSRLLAVNAAIEASRAGEQGRGFGVVAQEIKNLSEQSKKATSQVRTLLGDIQKAVNSSVLSMEQGSKAMDAGQQQAEQADEAIGQLAQSIQEAANAATQIAASSHQQLVGMDQVASAMENIKEAAGENVQSTKQLEAEVQNLYELSQKLKQTAERYKV